jgi:hypothetical protein
MNTAFRSELAAIESMPNLREEFVAHRRSDFACGHACHLHLGVRYNRAGLIRNRSQNICGRALASDSILHSGHEYG